jgi:alpha-galactosidase
LANGDVAVAILNRSGETETASINFKDLGLDGKYEMRDLWEHTTIGKGKGFKGKVLSHQTKLLRLKKVS